LKLLFQLKLRADPDVLFFSITFFATAVLSVTAHVSAASSDISCSLEPTFYADRRQLPSQALRFSPFPPESFSFFEDFFSPPPARH